MAYINCEKCNAQNEASSFFCKKCGRFLLASSFENAKISSDAEFKLKRIYTNLKENPHTNILWNDTVDAYTKKIERIQSLLRLKDLGINENELSQKIDQFLNLSRKADFEIAFVGTIKTGKSTLINALLGHEYASMDVTPETAALTKFRSSEKDYVHVKFYNKAEWESLWASVQKGADKFLQEYKDLNADAQKSEWVGHADKHIELANEEIEQNLAIWSSSKSAVHYFVKEIEVGISTLPRFFHKQVVFVDTPGLSDPVEYRSQISRDYIRKANAVIVCIDAQKIQRPEIETLSSVFSFSEHKKDKVFVVATHWDKLNNPQKDWEKQKAHLVFQLTGPGFYDTEDVAEKNIMHAAAYVYNLCAKYSSLPYRDKLTLLLLWGLLGYEMPSMTASIDLPTSNIEELKRVSNIEWINRVIVDELINQFTSLLMKDIQVLYQDIKHQVTRIAEERHTKINERITLSREEVKKVEEKIESVKKSRDKILQYQKQLDGMVSSMGKATQKHLKSLTSRF